MTLRQRINEILKTLKLKHPAYADAISRINVKVSMRMTAAAGYASYSSNTMKISGVYFSDPENIENGLYNTVTHEVAHLLLDPRVGHGIMWKMMHRRLGGSGERCHTMARKVPARRQSRHPLYCTGCGHTVHVGPVRFKRQASGFAQYICPLCKSRLEI